MIRKICISSRIGNYQSIDIGTIIESMLFYDKVYLRCSLDSISAILNYSGIDDFKNLIELGNLEFIVPKSFLAILSENNSLGERCQYINMFEPLGLNYFIDSLKKYNISIGKSRRIYQKISKYIINERVGDENINNMFEFLGDSEFVTKGFETSCKYYNIQHFFDFNILKLRTLRLQKGQIVVQSNTTIDTKKIENILTPQSFIVKLMHIKEMFDFAYENDARFLSDNLTSLIYQNYFIEKVKLINNNIQISDLFNEYLIRYINK